MNYSETCEYLYHQIPMFERQGSAGYKAGLDNTLALDEHLKHPHQSYATIHIAGTNGKGSCSHTIAAILQQCGYRVGLYTSPHLVDFRERIRVNGVPVSEEYVVDFIEKERGFFEPLHPSFFEITTAMAFQYFKDMDIDIAVVEVGLGGRLDCTNIISPILSVITNISFDHMQFLGNTLEKIAAEKAGIIKKGIPVVIGEANEQTRPVFEQKADEVGAPVIFAEDTPEVVSAYTNPGGGMHYSTKLMGDIDGDLGGIYQQKNMNTVLVVVRELSKLGYIYLSEDTEKYPRGNSEIREAVGHVAEKTGLMGRWQTIQTAPLVVCDTGHNVGGWQYVSQQLGQMRYRQLHIVFGMVGDKDVDAVLLLLPRHAKYYFTKADNERALDESQLLSMAAKHGCEGVSYPNVKEAYMAAMSAATSEDMIFVGGSSYVVGDFLKYCR